MSQSLIERLQLNREIKSKQVLTNSIYHVEAVWRYHSTRTVNKLTNACLQLKITSCKTELAFLAYKSNIQYEHHLNAKETRANKLWKRSLACPYAVLKDICLAWGHFNKNWEEAGKGEKEEQE